MDQLPKDLVFEIFSFIRTRHLSNIARTNSHLLKLAQQYLNCHAPSRPMLIQGRGGQYQRRIYLFPDDTIETFKEAYLQHKYYDNITFMCEKTNQTFILRNHHHIFLQYAKLQSIDLDLIQENQIYEGNTSIPQQDERPVFISDFWKDCTSIKSNFWKHSPCCYDCGTQLPSNLRCECCVDTFEVCLLCYENVETKFINCTLCGIRLETACAEECSKCQLQQCRNCYYDDACTQGDVCVTCCNSV